MFKGLTRKVVALIAAGVLLMAATAPAAAGGPRGAATPTPTPTPDFGLACCSWE